MSFVASTSSKNTGTAALPSGTEEGDSLYLFVSAYGASSIATPSGWTLVDSMVEPDYAPAVARAALFTRTVEESEPSSVTVSTPGASYVTLVFAAYRGETLTGEFRSGGAIAFPAEAAVGESVVAFGFSSGVGIFEDSSGVGFVPTQDWITGGSPAWTFWHAVAPGPIASPGVGVASTNSSTSHPLEPARWWVGYGGGEPPVPPDPLPGSPLQVSGDRLRSSFSESVGSLLESVEARAVDARAGEDFTNAQALEPAVRTEFREVTRARSGPVDFSYFPRPRQNAVEENQYEGITVLSRLASWYPPTMFDTVTALGIGAGGIATAQEVIQHVLDTWAGLVPWLTVGIVPDLRLRKEFFAPGSYGSSDGLVTTETVTIDQSGENRRDALAVLHDLLSPFPGTVVRQFSTGALAIQPIYGPDSDATPALTLDEDWDLYSVSRGRPDPFSVKNRATVTNSSYERGDEVALMQPAWFQIGSNYQLGLDTWFTPPGDRLNLQPPYGSDTTLQESLAFGQFSSQLPASWPQSSSSIAAGSGISLRDGSNDPTVTCAWRRYAGTSLADSGTDGFTLLEDEVPFDGLWRDTFRFSKPYGIGIEVSHITVRCRWDAASKSVQFSVPPGNLDTGCSTGCRGWVVEFTLNDSSVGYSAGASKSATFGVVDEGDALPADSESGNAVLDSQTAFGVLEATIDIRGYDLDLLTLQQIARAYVVQNITPRVTRDVELSSVGSRVTFDHVGRLVELPSGEQGYLVAVDYSDDFTAGSWRKSAQVQVANADADGAVPTTDIFYLDSNGEAYMSTVLALAGGAYEVTDDA